MDGEAGKNGADKRAFSPVGARQRVAVLDVLRGIAILGILAANLDSFRTPGFWEPLAVGTLSLGEGIYYFLVYFLASGKFITALAFLLGLGLALQAARARASDRPARRFLARRLVVLGLFGAAHALLVWSGDVLLFYALLGFPFLLFVLRRPKTLVIWAFAITVPLVLVGLVFTVVALLSGPAPAADGSVPLPSVEGDLSGAAQRAYESGSYREMVEARAMKYAVTLPLSLLFTGPQVFSMMLLGAAAANAGWMTGLSERRGVLRRVAFWGLVLGVPMNLFWAASLWWDPAGVTYVFVLAGTLWYVGAPIMALGWMALAALTLDRYRGAFSRLAAAGRMALTNYLAQSVLTTGIFYGFGLYGSAGVGAALGVMVGVWALELLWSRPWLSRYRYGPAEWLWRRLTYG